MKPKNRTHAAVTAHPPPAASWVSKTPGVCGGEACIRRTRHTVWGLVEWRKLGLSDAEILERHPDLAPADLEVAWDYYEHLPTAPTVVGRESADTEAHGERIQPVRSHEVEQVQLADLLIGTVGYANRGLDTNAAKLALMQRVQQRSGRGRRARWSRSTGGRSCGGSMRLLPSPGGRTG